MTSERKLPLEIVERDGHVTIRCTATKEQNNGEPCVWSWRLAKAHDTNNGNLISSAIQHCVDRHLEFIPYE